MLDGSYFENCEGLNLALLVTEPYENGVLVKGYRGPERILKLPRSIGGKPVLAITRLEELWKRYQIYIPDTVKELRLDHHRSDWCDSICIDPDNPHFVVADGLLLSADRSKVFMRVDTSLTDIRLPDEVRIIAPWAFWSDENLVSVHLGKGVHTIGKMAFPDTQAGFARFHGRHDGSYRKLALERITVSEENPFFASKDGFLYTKDFSALVRAPEIIPDGTYCVPAAVRRIEDEAFARNQGLHTLIAEHPLDVIGKKAFYDCFQLKRVRLAEAALVDEKAFCECEGLTDLNIGAMGHTANRAFAACTGLRRLAIGAAEAIAHGAFSECAALETVTLPEGLERINSCAFGWTGLREIVIPRSVKAIEEEAFYGCDGLNIIVYDTAAFNPGKIAYMRDLYDERWSCEKHWITVKSAADEQVLYRVYMGKSNGTSSGYREAVIGGWTNFPRFDFERLDAAFAELRDMDEKTEVIQLRLCYPVDLTEAAEKRYKDYLRRTAKKQLAVCVANDDTETVAFLAQQGVLQRAAIDAAVELCSGEKQPEMMALLLSLQNSAPGKAKDAFKMPSDTEMLKKLWSTQKLPDGTLELTSYKGYEEQVIVPAQIGKNKVTRIGEFAMDAVTANKTKAAKLKHIKVVEIPEGIIRIGDAAFRGCVNLEQVTFPHGLREIGAAAFCDCGRLTAAVIEEGAVRLGANAFRGCRSLKELSLPQSLTQIGASAFTGCESLRDERDMVLVRDVLYRYSGKAKSFAVPEGITRIDEEAFVGCIALEEIIIPEGVVEIGVRAFCGCKKLKQVTLPQSLRVLQYGAFLECAALRGIMLPDGLEHIKGWVFRNCKALQQIAIPNSVKVIDLEAFRGCKALTSVALSSQMEKIEASLFMGCSGLEEIVIPDGITVIEVQAFKNCSALRAVHVPSSVSEIHWNSFDGCHGAVIYGSSGSYAERYAAENIIPFVVTE